MPYIADDHRHRANAEELRARIPGWGADLGHADRPSVPRERNDLETGAHWVIPESQPDPGSRERSIEHGMLPPVFGTTLPLHGVSGVIQRFAYDRFSEGQTAHWLLLVLGDRVEVAGARARSVLHGRPDNPLTEAGVLGELHRHPVQSRIGQGRADQRHTWLDPLVAAGPFVLVTLGTLVLANRARRRGR